MRNDKGQKAIDIALPECKVAMEKALLLLEKFDVVKLKSKLTESKILTRVGSCLPESPPEVYLDPLLASPAQGRLCWGDTGSV